MKNVALCISKKKICILNSIEKNQMMKPPRFRCEKKSESD